MAPSKKKANFGEKAQRWGAFSKLSSFRGTYFFQVTYCSEISCTSVLLVLHLTFCRASYQMPYKKVVFVKANLARSGGCLKEFLAHPAGLRKEPLLHPIWLVNRDPYDALL